MTDPAPTTTTDKKQRAPARPPTRLSQENEAMLARMKATIKAPGTDLGVLVRGLETRLRDIQGLLDAKGRTVTTEGALGRQREVPVTVSLLAAVAVQVGTDEPQVFDFGLAPDRAAMLYAVEVSAIDRTPPAPPIVPESIEVRDDDESAVLYVIRPTTRTPHQVQVGAEPWPADGRLAWWNPATPPAVGWRDENPEEVGVRPGTVVWAVPVGKPEAPPVPKRRATDMGPDDDPTATPPPVSEPDLTAG